MTRQEREGDGRAAASDGARGLAFFVALLLLVLAARLLARAWPFP